VLKLAYLATPVRTACFGPMAYRPFCGKGRPWPWQSWLI